jgi:hypothetical protein
MLQFSASCSEPLVRIELAISPDRVGDLLPLIGQVDDPKDLLLGIFRDDLLRETPVTRLADRWLLDFRRWLAAGLLLAHFLFAPLRPRP